jgi:hypothetical protein
VVFALTPDNSDAAWKETALYAFCTQSGCTDGEWPLGRLTVDAAGNLYRTTSEGGTGDYGVVYRLAPGNTGTAWTESVTGAMTPVPAPTRSWTSPGISTAQPRKAKMEKVRGTASYSSW